jgi:YggT family protein
LFQLATLDAAGAASVAGALGPFLSVATLLFIIRRVRCCGAPGTRCRAMLTRSLLARRVRIVMTWYPNIKDDAFPWLLVYAPTEPLLAPTRKLITPVGCGAARALLGEGSTRADARTHEPPADARTLARSGVDVSPIVWVAAISFTNEILLGKQGLLVLLSQKVQ